ncbi:hypothetical protein V8C42DRAFT_210664 [Trichoderma barbatum]
MSQRLLPCFSLMHHASMLCQQVSLGRRAISSESGCAQFLLPCSQDDLNLFARNADSSVWGVSVSLTALGVPLPRRSACYQPFSLHGLTCFKLARSSSVPPSCWIWASLDDICRFCRRYLVVPNSMPALAWVTQQITTCRRPASSPSRPQHTVELGSTWIVWRIPFAVCCCFYSYAPLLHASIRGGLLAILRMPHSIRPQTLKTLPHDGPHHVCATAGESLVISSLHCWMPRRLTSLFTWGTETL